MRWFLEKISASDLPVIFGIQNRRAYPTDFDKLVQTDVIVRRGNVDAVECAVCKEATCQVREKNGKLFYVCDNGCGRFNLTDEDVALYEYDNAGFLRLLCAELGIKNNGRFDDEAAYTDATFFRVGTYNFKGNDIDVFYLRTDDAFEPSEYLEQMSDTPKMLLANIAKPQMAFGKTGTLYCTLADILAPATSSKLFSKPKFAKCFERVRRVHFDVSEGHLSLDGTIIYTAGLNSPEYYFLKYLWQHWEEQVPHGDTHKFIREGMGHDVEDNPQVFTPKMKSSIKKTCPMINTIIKKPTTGHYMMSDPIE